MNELVLKSAVACANRHPDWSGWTCATFAVNTLFRQGVLGQEAVNYPTLRIEVANYLEAARLVDSVNQFEDCWP